MKVALPTRNAYPFQGYGGAQRYSYHLALALASQGVNVTIILPSTRGFSSEMYHGLAYVFIPPGAQMNYGRFYTSYQPWMCHVAHYICEEGFDLVHTFASGVSFYGNLRGRIPVIIQNFGNELFKSYGLRWLVRRLLYYPYVRRQFQIADGVASQGLLQDEEIVRLYGISRAKIFRLPSGVDLSHIAKCLAAEPRLTRSELGVEPGDLLLMNVGRLVYYKGVDYLLEAMASLRSEIPYLRLLLVGTGPDEPRLRRLIMRLDLSRAVIHRKNISDQMLFQCYALANLFIMPSSNEGFPLVTLEAMACGLPVIGTNNNENIQVIRDGENGLLIPPQDALAIAAAICRLQDGQLRERMGAKAKELVQSYDWQVIAGMALDKYKELLKTYPTTL